MKFKFQLERNLAPSAILDLIGSRFDLFCRNCGGTLHPFTKFQQNRTIRGKVLMIQQFSSPF